MQTQAGEDRGSNYPKPAAKDRSFVADQEELNFAPLWQAEPATRRTGHIYLQGASKRNLRQRKTKWSRCMVCGCRPPAASARPAADKQPSPGRPPCLPSWGLTQKIPHPAPGLQNSSNAPERPPFVLHSSNQLSTAHLLSTGAQTPGHCSSVC